MGRFLFGKGSWAPGAARDASVLKPHREAYEAHCVNPLDKLPHFGSAVLEHILKPRAHILKQAFVCTGTGGTPSHYETCGKYDLHGRNECRKVNNFKTVITRSITSNRQLQRRKRHPVERDSMLGLRSVHQ